MTIILLVLLVIAIGLLVQQYRYRRRISKHASFMDAEYMKIQAKLGDAYSAYAALETGQQEIIDNYENDLLDMNEKLEAARNSAAYDREMREKAEKLMDLQNTVIEKHADGCESILQEIADAIVADILPPKEEAGG